MQVNPFMPKMTSDNTQCDGEKTKCHLKSLAKDKLSNKQWLNSRSFAKDTVNLILVPKSQTIIFAESMEIWLIKEMACSFQASVHYLPEYTKMQPE